MNIEYRKPKSSRKGAPLYYVYLCGPNKTISIGKITEEREFISTDDITAMKMSEEEDK